MKKRYSDPELEFIPLAADVIVTSGEETPEGNITDTENPELWD